MQRQPTLLSSLNLHRLDKFPLPCLQVCWLLWIAAIGIPNWGILIGFLLAAYLLYAFMSLATTAIDKSLAEQSLNRLHTTELLALLFASIVILDLLTNWLTIWLSVISFIFLALTLILRPKFKRLSNFCYAATWAWFAPLAFSAQGKDLETISWILATTLLFWTLTWRSIHERATSDTPATHCLAIACLMAISFACFIITGMLSGQVFWFFWLLILILVTLIFLLDLIHKGKAKLTLPFLPAINLFILAGIILSYHR